MAEIMKMKLDQNLCKNGDRTKLLPYTNFYIEAFACDMTLRSYFGNQNSTLGSVVPLAMFNSSMIQTDDQDDNA